MCEASVGLRGTGGHSEPVAELSGVKLVASTDQKREPRDSLAQNYYPFEPWPSGWPRGSGRAECAAAAHQVATLPLVHWAI